MKHTKIVATISDQRCDVEFIEKLVKEGVNVARLNTAHINYDGIKKLVTNIRAVSDSVGILMDTKGPEIRTTVCEGTIYIKTGQKITVVGAPGEQTTPDRIAVSYTGIAEDVKIGDNILIDDGEIDLKVIDKTRDSLLVEAMNNGELGARKSVNVPGVRINLPSLTARDKENIGYAMEFGIDFIAHSFVRNRQDIKDIQDILDAKGSQIKIIAKIENQEGVDNIDEILEGAYGVMVARGDLGIEVPQEEIPAIQRQLIRTCVKAKKPVIVATQMLHSMIKNPRPTRAEVTDIANAIYYRTDAVMLSGETAYGEYPVEAVRTMAKIAATAEKSKLEENDIRIPSSDDERSITAFLSKQAVRAEQKVGCKAIINNSISGGTARNLAAFRGKNPVYSVCFEGRVVRELSLSYGVFPRYFNREDNEKGNISNAIERLIKKGAFEEDDIVAFVGGTFGEDLSSTILELTQAKRLAAKKNW